MNMYVINTNYVTSCERMFAGFRNYYIVINGFLYATL